MLLKRKYSKQSKGSKPPKSVNPPYVFDSIKNLVISKWWDIHEANDFTILLKEPAKKSLIKTKYFCYDIWDEIQEQYIGEFGIPNKSKEYYSKVSEVTILRVNHSLSQDNWDLTLLNIGIRELEELTTSEKKQSNFKTKSIIENILGRDYIDPDKVKVIDYYHYVELAEQKSADGKRYS